MRAPWIRGLLGLNIDSGWIPTMLFAVVITTATILFARSLLPSNRASTHEPAGISTGIVRRCHRAAPLAAGAVLGFAIGFSVTWLLDHFLVFGVMLGIKVVWAAAIGVALFGMMVAQTATGRGPTRVAAAVMIPVSVLSCAVNINAVYGEYPTLGSVLGVSSFARLDYADLHDARMPVGRWRTLAESGNAPDMPAHGRTGSVIIPATESGFRAREAVAYLPPAALSKTPPRLPVFIMLSGQPGSPDRAFLAGDLTAIFDEYASRHHGLAPVVVSADQLGNAFHNTLCVDSPKYGNAETYLTRDVTDWITANLPVSHDPRQWAIGGFSQGGTCAIQLGPSHPDLYGAMFTVGAELGPHDGDEQTMVREFFGGSEERYRRHVPIDIMRSRRHSDQMLVMAAGQLDDKSTDNIERIVPVARSIGMDATGLTVVNAGHDWHAVQQALKTSLDAIGVRMGLSDDVHGMIRGSAQVLVMDIATEDDEARSR
ncbi:esterase [Bifidobacterium margollesii]|uniref:Esterase n=1 Tax=Bifidobacterium margollesii TaxID=2020964 RepID=A0A2N5JBX1_9BIFI|nr:alpha/beta hydrolase-fold protein [Bifidobacterium margollesii]PLS31681.1 esterase [Bifidobacterium margollesii]